MTIRTKIAQVALTAMIFGGAVSTAHAESYEEKLLARPLPAKLLLVDVDTSECRDLEDTVGIVNSFNSVCPNLQGYMPEYRKLGLIRARVRNVLFPKALDANGKRTGERIQRVASLDEQRFSRLTDYQVVSLGYQLGVQMR